jgi:2-C-methyl-D-erythritol 4-phosphate cytidylyltransferase
VVVVPKGWVERVRAEVKAVWPNPDWNVVSGGGTRQESVTLGVKGLAREVEVVLVHDAARPYVSRRLIESVLDGALAAGACIPVLRVTDTVKEIQDSTVVRSLDRDRIGFAQTPQGFRRPLLEAAIAKAEADGFAGTDEASLVEHLGATVKAVAGEIENRKVTWPDDLVIK